MSWKCPDCSAPANKHGKGNCIQPGGGSCSGLICDCEEDTGGVHGSVKEPCPNARCYHCGWAGEFPEGMVKCPTCQGAGKVHGKPDSSKKSQKRSS